MIDPERDTEEKYQAPSPEQPGREDWQTPEPNDRFAGYEEGEDEEFYEEEDLVPPQQKPSEENEVSQLRLAGSYVVLQPPANYLREKSQVPLNESDSSNLSLTPSGPLYQIVTELGPEEVRWFYQEGKKIWKPFIGYDSLRIERTFRRLWDLRVGTSADTWLGSSEPVTVRGGLYEVDVAENGCFPIYWQDTESTAILRGQWFMDGSWQPLPEEDSDLIEREHLGMFSGQHMAQSLGQKSSAVFDSKLVIRTLKLRRSHVDWHSSDEVVLYSDATTSKLARKFTQKLGFSKPTGTRVHRGYVEEASLEDKPPRTTHIVFVVHGVGQKMEQGSIIKNTTSLREMAKKVEEKYFSNNKIEHVEFFPVEWRSKLILDGDTVHSITPHRISRIRHILNSSAMDILYYTSPLYRDELVKGLQEELNRLYTLFCSQNPEFHEQGGKVSILSHSLGCVISYDIMTGWNPVRLCEQFLLMHDAGRDQSWSTNEERYLMEELSSTKEHLKEVEERLHILRAATMWESHALKFKVEYFFCMGSPLAVFLALRGIRPDISGGQDHIMSKKMCKRMFNIFYPTDPVAYRLEPLILKSYSVISPVQVHWYNTTNPVSYQLMKPCFLKPYNDATNETAHMPSSYIPPAQCGESETSQSTDEGLSFGRGIGGLLSMFTQGPTFQSSDIAIYGAENDDSTSFYSPSNDEHGFSDDASYLEPRMVLENRIDFELREGLVESSYVSALTSHTAYWGSMDVMLFVLTFLYNQDAEEEV